MSPRNAPQWAAKAVSGDERAVTVVFPYPPSANAYWRHNRGRTHVSDEARKYRNAVKLMALAAGWRPQEGECSVVVDVYRPQRRGDLDNTLKVLLDALRGAAYRDDSQVKTISASRHDDKARPRAEVSIVWSGGTP